MLCPACRKPLHEHTSACPHCGFDLAAAEQAFGAPPRLNPDLTDLAGVLSMGDERRLLEALRINHSRFPQVTFAIVIARVHPQVPLRAYTFWIFNQGILTSLMDKGGACRLVLLTVDADAGRAACMVGYGLEPFVGEDSLDRIVSAALPSLGELDYAGALTTALAQADAELTTISEGLPQAFGLHDEEDELVPGTEAFAY